MDKIVKVKDYFFPQKTWYDYIKENPTTVVKGAAAGVIAWYTVPVVAVGIMWLPYLGAGYYIYTNTRTAQKSYSWYKWGKSYIS